MAGINLLANDVKSKVAQDLQRRMTPITPSIESDKAPSSSILGFDEANKEKKRKKDDDDKRR